MLQNDILTANKFCSAKLLQLQNIFDWDEIDFALSKLEQQKIDEFCWVKPAVFPTVNFVAAYHPKALIIKFQIAENSHQAVYQQTNEPVFKDSCVEFFVAPDDSGNYYNFEFNSLGTCLASYGKNRYNRKKLSSQQIETIKRRVKWMENSPSTQSYNWEIIIALPPAIFSYHNINNFATTSYKVNFYKCGDDLIPLHYLAWNRITSPNPDFHQPKYFGVLQLM